MEHKENGMYWSFNLPLQVWPGPDGEPEQVLNYIPRTKQCVMLDLDAVRADQTRDEFLNKAADVLENLAALMRVAAANPTVAVYYPDQSPAEALANALARL